MQQLEQGYSEPTEGEQDLMRTCRQEENYNNQGESRLFFFVFLNNILGYNTKLIYNAPECLELDDSQANYIHVPQDGLLLNLTRNLIMVQNNNVHFILTKTYV